MGDTMVRGEKVHDLRSRAIQDLCRRKGIERKANLRRHGVEVVVGCFVVGQANVQVRGRRNEVANHLREVVAAAGCSPSVDRSGDDDYARFPAHVIASPLHGGPIPGGRRATGASDPNVPPASIPPGVAPVSMWIPGSSRSAVARLVRVRRMVNRSMPAFTTT